MAATVAAAGASSIERSKAEDVENLLASLRAYSTFLYGGSMVASLAQQMAPRIVAPATSYASGRYNVLCTAALFVAATALLPGWFTRILERKPTPVPRLTPRAAWPLAFYTWGCITMFFHGFLTLGGDDIVVHAD